ncbi:MAG: C69 family dipeptidase [Thermoplasmata archaeon]
MCDTLVSMNQNNADKNVTYFAKNSDREPGETQLVEYYPRIMRDKTVKCTYVDVAFAGESNAIVISRPYWMWGAEMGVNEYGVAIGNEALFTKRKFEKKGLLGMDLLRLGLEKGKSAEEALRTISQYIEEYGQGGSNSLNKDEYYDNSFMIADKEESYILETSGKTWISAKIDRFGSISNSVSIKEQGKLDFRPDFLYTHFGRGHERAEITRKMLNSASGKVTVEEIMKIMRMHNEPGFLPKKGSNKDICMHSGSLTRRFQTANSMIVELGSKFMLLWFTYSPNPCISLYKPLFIGVENAAYNKEYWENAEKLHRALANTTKITYSKAMDETVRSQTQIIETVKDLRDKINSGGEIEKSDVDKIYEEARIVDEKHLDALKALL